MYLFAIIALGLSGWLLSGAVHEAGHALAGKAGGLEIVDLQPWVLLGRVHVRFSGETSRFWYAATDISGMLFTVFLGLLGVLTVAPLSRRWPAYRLSFVLFFPMVCQCLAWLVLPIYILLGGQVPTDDVAKFIHRTGWHPFAVSAMGLLLAVLSGIVIARVFGRRETIENWGRVFKAYPEKEKRR